MKMTNALIGTLLGTLWASGAGAADNPGDGPTVHWQVAVVPADAKPGDNVEVVFTADIAPGWILYSSDFKLDIGPLPTRFTFDTNPGLSLVGTIRPIEAQWKNDSSLGGTYSYFSGHAQFRQNARLVGSLESVSGRINGQTCFEENGLCKLFRETFRTQR
jgi:thiol:disulfide interchange protein DsbD